MVRSRRSLKKASVPVFGIDTTSSLEPLWISSYEPFHGVNKKDLGFQVILKVAAEEEKKDEEKKDEAKGK